MSFLAHLLLAATHQPSTTAVANERVAARAVEAHLSCLARGMDQKAGDSRAIEIVAAEINSECETEATQLLLAMEDVFRRNPDRITGGLAPDAAASAYVMAWNERTKVALRELRERDR